MIHIVNHHTAYSYSKLTCRHPSLGVIKTKLKNKVKLASLLLLQRVRKHQANHYTKTKFNPSMSLRSSWQNIVKSKSGVFKSKGGLKPKNVRIQNSGQGSLCSFAMPQVFHKAEAKENKGQNKFFKSKPLLCWRSDLAFFNLRWYFLNCFKALHLCWSAARNHKRIAFVGVDDNLQSQSSLESIAKLFKIKTFLRDALPDVKQAPTISPQNKPRQTETSAKKKLITSPSLCSVKKEKESQEGIFTFAKGEEPAMIKQKYKSYQTRRQAKSHQTNLMLFGQLIRFLRSCDMKWHKANDSSDAEPCHKTAQGLVLTHTDQITKQHLLQSKISFVSSRQSAFLYNNACTGFFSNPERPFKTIFNNFNSSLPSSEMISYDHVSNVDMLKLKPGLKQYPLNLNSIGLSPRVSELSWRESPKYDRRCRQDSLVPELQRHLGLGRTKKLASSDATAVLSLCLWSTSELIHSIGQRATLGVKKTAPEPNRQADAFWNQHFNLCHAYTKSKLKKAQLNLRTASPKSKKVPLRIHFKNHFVSAKRSLSFKPWWQKQNYYADALVRNLTKDYQKFASNPSLKQADIIFFTNPDKTPALAAQARRLRIPTIGLVSGLKPKQTWGTSKHINQKDSVDYPILGNSDNSFFVLMMVRMFMNLISKAYQKPSPWPNAKLEKTSYQKDQNQTELHQNQATFAFSKGKEEVHSNTFSKGSKKNWQDKKASWPYEISPKATGSKTHCKPQKKK
jgi:hypothetical protein